MKRPVVLAVLAGLVAVACATPPSEAPAPPPAAADERFDEAAWRAELERWRAERETRLRSDYGWLSVVGLDWLEPGPNRVGSDPDGEIHLPAEVAPAHVATLVVEGDRVRLEPVPGAPLTVNGEPATTRFVRTDVEPDTDTFEVGDVRFHVLRRGARLGVRARWPRAPARTAFSGLTWYPPDPAWRGVGRLEPVEDGTVPVPDVLGDVTASRSPGRVRVEVAGHALTLTALQDSPDDDELFLIFRDATSGHGTYPAGRFLYAPLRADGSVVVDFNRAYSPPCAFTPHATCPLPPPGNALDVAVEAGERFEGHGGS